MTEYDKLVRDEIPHIVRENGDRPVTATVSGSEYRGRLREKLCEEAAEFRDSGGDPEELADVVEVLAAIRSAEPFDEATVERLREEKAAERGRFADGVVLERVE